jgi:hypothetical protein
MCIAWYVAEAIAAAENVDSTAVKTAMPDVDPLHNPDGEEVRISTVHI